MTVSVHSGLGRHLETLVPLQITTSLECIWISFCILIHGVCLGRWTVIAFLLRIQDRVQSRKMTYLSYSLLIFGASNFIINMIEMCFILTACSPRAKLWDPSLDGNCNGAPLVTNFGYFHGGVHIPIPSFEPSLMIVSSLGNIQ